MPPKKNKGQKVDLATFMSETAITGNWADEMDDLPIAPAMKDPNALKRGDPGYFDSIPDRGSRGGPGGGMGGFDSSRPPREELPLPSRPPYTVFVGNLDFATTEEDMRDFFEGLEMVSAKLIRDMDQKPKGFGYVEFKTLDGLKDALGRSGGQMLGRTIRTSVAEPPKESGRGGGFGERSTSGGFGAPSMAEEASQWRRAGPLPARSPPAQRRNLPSSGGFERQDRGFSSGAGGDALDRDWGGVRGSKFAPGGPSAPPERSFGSGFRAGPPGGDFGGPERAEREQHDGPSMAELPDDWRSNRPARPTPPPSAGPAMGGPGPRRDVMGPPRGGFVDREVGLSGPAETEEVWQRGTKFQPRQEPPHQPARSRESSFAPAGPTLSSELEEKSDWRSTKKPSAPRVADAASSNGAPAQPTPPPTRKGLSLLPRGASVSTPTSETGDSVTSPPTTASSKASPFGSARPIDTAAKENAAAEKLAQRDADRKAQAEAKAKAAAATAAIAAEERAKAAANAPPAAHVQAHDRPQTTGARHPSRGGQGPTGPNRPPPPPPPPAAAQRKSSGPQPPSTERRSSNTRHQHTEDSEGFSAPPPTSTQSRKAQAAAEQQAQQKIDRQKAEEVRPTFSFAAAARAQALVEDVGEGDDDDDEEEVVEKVNGGVKVLKA